jgi:hypothetical protein
MSAISCSHGVVLFTRWDDASPYPTSLAGQTWRGSYYVLASAHFSYATSEAMIDRICIDEKAERCTVVTGVSFVNHQQADNLQPRALIGYAC